MNIIYYIKQIKLSIYLFFSIVFLININIIIDVKLEKILSSLIYIDLIILLTGMLFFIVGYYVNKKNYEKLVVYINGDKNLNLKNYKLKELIDKKILEKENIIYELKKELEEINDYMTKWIHEIKIPISVLEIISQRIKDMENELNSEYELHKHINIEIKRIDNLVQQALYISKSGDYSSNFLIEEINVEKIIKEIIKKNKYLFIYNKIDLELGNLNYTILSDKKWLIHIIEQILNNSCKYIKEKGVIKVYVEESDSGIKLHIKDNGIGIKKEDINRVFDKGYVGNHNEITKSTGMGLYVSKKILNKLSHNITINSKENEYCDVCITFYKLSDYFNIT